MVLSMTAPHTFSWWWTIPEVAHGSRVPSRRHDGRPRAAVGFSGTCGPPGGATLILGKRLQMNNSAAALLARLTAPGAPAFALLHRRTPRLAPDTVELLIGEVGRYQTLAELPLPTGAPADGRPRHDLLALVPYRQLSERGFEVHDDGTPLQALAVTEQYALPLAEVLAALPDLPVALTDGAFDIDDEEYAGIVRRVIEDEIGRGEGANFVIRRDFRATLRDWSPQLGLSLLRRLLSQERGAYWTFLVSTGERLLVGASPRSTSGRAAAPW